MNRRFRSPGYLDRYPGYLDRYLGLSLDFDSDVRLRPHKHTLVSVLSQEGRREGGKEKGGKRVRDHDRCDVALMEFGA